MNVKNREESISAQIFIYSIQISRCKPLLNIQTLNPELDLGNMKGMHQQLAMMTSALFQPFNQYYLHAS